LTATATVEFPGGGADTQFPHLTGRAEFKGLELERLAALAPERRTQVSGTLGGTASIEWTAPGLSNLNAAFDLNASRLVAGERDFGSPSVRGRITDGLLVSSGSCCCVSVAALGQLTDSGLQQVNLSAAASDLAVLASAFGRDGLAGSGTVKVELADIGSSLSLAATAEFPDLKYRHIQAGPVRVEASGLDGSYDLLYEAFDSTLLGRASLDPDGDYTASVRAHAFDLAAVLEDSLREAMSLAGLVTGTAAVSGDLGGAYAVTGEISELDLAARRQNAALKAPFSFTASPDSIRLTEAVLAGTFGEASVAGRLSTSDAIDIALTFDGAELSEITELLPRPPDAPPRGQLAGSVVLAGTRDSPVFSADIRLREFEMAGFAVESATLEASGDSSDVVFDLTAESTGSGVISVCGSVPVAPDSVTVLRFDSSREFGVSIWTEGFTLDAGESVLPQVRGEKRFRLDGSALVTGTVDSLASLNGSGQFAQLSAAFDLAEFAFADTVGFEVESGVFRVDQLVIDVVRTHVLGEPDGGRLVLSSSVVPGGDVSLDLTAEDLDVGHIARTLGYSWGSEFRGRLNAEAVVSGLPSDPRASFSWFVDSPRIADFGFDRAQGAGTLEAGVLKLETAEFLASDGALRVAGEVDVRSEDGETLPVFDISLTADGFRLKALRALPPELTSLEGRVDADLRVSRSADGVSADGTLSLTDGEVGGADLAKPARHVALDVEVKGETVLLNRATAEFGAGSIVVSGLADLSSGLDDPTFFMTGQFRAPEFEIEKTLEGRIAGNIDWGGTLSRSVLRGHIVIEEMTVTRSVGVSDFVGRGPTVTIVRRQDDPGEAVSLDLDVEIEDVIEIYSNVADLSLEGGASIGGTLAKPRISGSVHAEEGTFSYLDNDFEIDALSVSFIDPERRDPYVDLSGTAEVESRSGESYQVTARLNGYLSDAVPELHSTPSLSRPDIVSLLTFGDTFGTMTSGGPGSDSSGGAFSHLASTVFLSSAFGLAESTLERLLHLDRVAFDQEELASGDESETETETSVTLGKKFGDRLRVNYSTAVGSLSNQKVEISFELAKRFWLETRTDPEGNHAVGLKLQISFK
ncbi:translocation/assembly module TamB domain-containing protein, partial [bacterium]|nr:translocation/assembly module TamB domain-containing protein [bacterium]